MNTQIFNEKLIAFLESHKGENHKLYFQEKNFRSFFICIECEKVVTCKNREIIKQEFRPSLFDCLDIDKGMIISPLKLPRQVRFLINEYNITEEIQMTIDEETKKRNYKDILGYGFHDRILASSELHAIKFSIEEWKESQSGINSGFAQPIVDRILKLCQEIRTATLEEVRMDKATENPYPDLGVHYNYSEPVQTNLEEWSVFVRKFNNGELQGVIQHKFLTQTDAELFSKNNWCLGDYF